MIKDYEAIDMLFKIKDESSIGLQIGVLLLAHCILEERLSSVASNEVKKLQGLFLHSEQDGLHAAVWSRDLSSSLECSDDLLLSCFKSKL